MKSYSFMMHRGSYCCPVCPLFIYFTPAITLALTIIPKSTFHSTWCDSEGLWHNLLHQQNMALSLTSTKNKSFIKTEVVNQRVSVTKLVGSTKYWVNQPLQLGVGRIVAFWWNRVPNAPKNLFYPVFRRKIMHKNPKIWIYPVFRRKKGYLKPKIRFFGFIKNTDPTPKYSVGVILILVDTVSMKEWQVHQRRTGKSEYQKNLWWKVIIAKKENHSSSMHSHRNSLSWRR